eukprot:8017428-Pyramimonas_sp.AAC.1
MREEAARFYETLFKDPTYASLPRWIWKRWGPMALEELPKRLGAQLSRKCLSRLKPGKTCSRDDCIVMEMLKELSTETLDLLAELYVLRLRNHPSEQLDPIFNRHQVTLLAKFYGACRVKDCRPIALLSCLLKLYSMCLSELIELDQMPLSKLQFAFRKSYQVHKVVATTRLLIERAVEFREPLFLG